jgi:hypothetical protein
MKPDVFLTTSQSPDLLYHIDAPDVVVDVMQVHPNTLSALSSNIVKALSPPITVRYFWRRTSRYGYHFPGAASKLEACCRASAAQLQIQVTPEAKPDARILSGLTAFVSRGMHMLEVMWLTQEVQTAAHLQALGHRVGQYITHLTLVTETSITDQIWSGLWAAFPHLEYLSLHTSSFIAHQRLCTSVQPHQGRSSCTCMLTGPAQQGVSGRRMCQAQVC